MKAFYSFDRENLVRRWFSTDGVDYRLTTSRMNRDTLTRQTVHSAFLPDSMEWMVGVYLTQFHGSDTITIGLADKRSNEKE